MKFSELWLREWISTELDIEIIANLVTMAGLKVESIKPVAKAFSGVVIGEITEHKKHPSENKLYVTKVNIGKKNLLDIVHSESDLLSGMKVAVATTDAVLPKDFKTKIVRIEKKESEGLLCPLLELGIPEYQKNAVELPSDAPIGMDIREYLRLDDNIIEVSVTPNRADCLSVFGIAKDIAAVNEIRFDQKEITSIVKAIDDIVSIKVDIPKACPRYLARIVKGININVSTPLWMKEKLRRCGIDSTNVALDIASYILLELGQPIQVFDEDKIDGGIMIRMAKEGESFVLTGGKKIKLNGDTLVVSDYKKILAISGIFYEGSCIVNEKTKNVLLESAFFSPSFIIGKARCYNLCTESSYRYERGVDPELQYKAIERMTSLLTDICGGKPGSIVNVTSEENLPKRTVITLRRRKLDKLTGCHITDNLVKNILSRLGFKVIKVQDKWKVTTPSWRFDVKIEEDLIGEIVRVYGNSNIPSKPIFSNSNAKNCFHSIHFLRRVKTLLNDRGYQEVITYSFVDPTLQALIHPDKEPLILQNPVSNEMSAMRLSLWTGLIKTIIYNQNRQQSRIRIFEAGLRFIPDSKSDLGVRQEFVLSGAINGNFYEDHWDLEKRVVDFYDIKGDLEAILDLTGKLHEIKFCTEVIPGLHPGKRAAVYLYGKCIGFIGVIHPKLEKKINLDRPTVLFEIEWGRVFERIATHNTQIKEISRFPFNRRDITILVDKKIPAADILIECKKIDKNRIINVNLFDVYCGKSIKEGYKSLSISLILQDTDHTLKDKEISLTIKKCIEMLKRKFHASLREKGSQDF